MSDDRLIRIENKVDKISERINSVDVTLAAQHESLKDHMRRTELLEQAVEPLKSHLNAVHMAAKLIGVIVGIITVGAAVVEIFSYLKR